MSDCAHAAVEVIPANGAPHYRCAVCSQAVRWVDEQDPEHPETLIGWRLVDAEEGPAMSDERDPRPWRVEQVGDRAVIECAGGETVYCVDDTGVGRGAVVVALAALVGAVNAADRALPLEQVLADLAAGKVG